MKLLPRRIMKYYPHDQLYTFLPDHLRRASKAGITIHKAVWDPSTGGAYVDVSGIDTDNPAHLAVGAEAGNADGSDGGYRRDKVDAIPEELKNTIQF